MRVSFQFVLVSLAAVASVQAWSPSRPSMSISSSAAMRSLKRTSPTQAIAVPLDGDFVKSITPQQEAKEAKEQLPRLAPKDEWIAKLDYEAFGKEVALLGKQLLQETGSDDVRHLQKIVNWRNTAALLGVATMWTAPLNPISVVALSTWTYASWTMIAHHTCHGGYNRVEGAGKFHSRGFALGTLKRRIADWLDWMEPEAWNIEHNRLHHYRLNEQEDPDLVQRNLEFVRQDKKMPMALKYAIVFAFMPIWKWFYYAPNTYKELQIARWTADTGSQLPEHVGAGAAQAMTVSTLLRPKNDNERALLKIVKPATFFSRVVAPFFLMRFVFLPLPLLAIPGGLGPSLFRNAIINLVAAELLTNIHAFITIVTNHAGEDLYTFQDAVKPKTPSFYVRQIVGSANYKAGTDLVDFSHGFLNYQVEHHVWPDMSMLQYQRGAPRLKALCEKYGVPYVQESVWERLRKTLRVMVGKTTMRPFPTEYEPSKDKALKGVSWKTTNGAIDE